MRCLFVCVCVVGAVACRPESAEKQPRERGRATRTVHLSAQALEAAGVELVQVSVGSFQPSVSAAGFIRPDARRSVIVRAPGEGRVVRVAVDVGTSLKAGDTVAIIESPEANSALARHRVAAAREAAARRALERAERLLALQGISRAERDSRLADAEAAAAEAEAARRDLTRLGLTAGTDDARLAIKAPVTGTVLEVSAAEGGLVAKDAPLAVVADLSQVWAVVEVSDADGARVETGISVEVHCDAYPGQTFPGRVALVEPSMGDAAGRVRVRVVMGNASLALKPGHFVTVDLPTSAAAAQAMAVPAEAIQHLFGITAVFAETAPGSFEARVVETGRESAGRVEVVRGLREGDRIVVRGAFTLKTELLKSSLAAEEEK